jgi:hypothetical protein
MQRDGRVSGLHTLLVARGSKVLFELCLPQIVGRRCPPR